MIATVHLSGAAVAGVSESSRPVTGDPGVSNAHVLPGEVVMTVGSGHYSFANTRPTVFPAAASTAKASSHTGLVVGVAGGTRRRGAAAVRAPPRSSCGVAQSSRAWRSACSPRAAAPESAPPHDDNDVNNDNDDDDDDDVRARLHHRVVDAAQSPVRRARSRGQRPRARRGRRRVGAAVLPGRPARHVAHRDRAQSRPHAVVGRTATAP